jgi:hypothetical protein
MSISLSRRFWNVLYWRIIEELKYLGEALVFHDPSLKRCYEEWIRRKADVLSRTRSSVSYMPSEHELT